MRRPQDEFWNSSLCQVATMIDMYTDEEMIKASAMNNTKYDTKYFGEKEEVVDITSMKQVKGWY